MRSLVTVCRVSTSALVLDHISPSLALYSKQSWPVMHGPQNFHRLNGNRQSVDWNNLLLDRCRCQYRSNRKELLFVTCRSLWRKSWDFPWATSRPRPRWEAQHPPGPLISLPNLNIQILYDALEMKVQVHLSRKDCIHEEVSEALFSGKIKKGGVIIPDDNITW